MKSLLFFVLLLCNINAYSQLWVIELRGASDTADVVNPITGQKIQINRFGIAAQTVTALGGKADTSDITTLLNLITAQSTSIKLKQSIYTSAANQQVYNTPVTITANTSFVVFRNGVAIDYTVLNTTQIQITPTINIGDKIKILQL